MMKKFLVNSLYLSLPILVVAIFLEILLRNIPNDYRCKKEYLDKHSGEIETLILGNSHTWYGLNPGWFSSKAFNASNVSQSLDFDFEILKKYQNNFKDLKTIILPISYFSLFERLGTGPEAWRIKNYVIYYKINKSESVTNYSEVLSNKLKVNWDRLDTYYFLKKSNLTCNNLGWYRVVDTEGSLAMGKSTANRHTVENLNDPIIQRILQENEEVLHSIINWSKKRNVRVIFFTPPAFESYRINLNSEQLNLTIKTIRKMDQEFDNCVYYNLLDDTTFKANDFCNADHLNEVGAQKLSKFINEKIENWK